MDLEAYIQANEQTEISTVLQPPNNWGRLADDMYSILKLRHLQNILNHINNFHQNINPSRHLPAHNLK